MPIKHSMIWYRLTQRIPIWRRQIADLARRNEEQGNRREAIICYQLAIYGINDQFDAAITNITDLTVDEAIVNYSKFSISILQPADPHTEEDSFTTEIRNYLSQDDLVSAYTSIGRAISISQERSLGIYQDAILLLCRLSILYDSETAINYLESVKLYAFFIDRLPQAPKIWKAELNYHYANAFQRNRAFNSSLPYWENASNHYAALRNLLGDSDIDSTIKQANCEAGWARCLQVVNQQEATFHWKKASQLYSKHPGRELEKALCLQQWATCQSAIHEDDTTDTHWGQIFRAFQQSEAMFAGNASNSTIDASRAECHLGMAAALKHLGKNEDAVIYWQRAIALYLIDDYVHRSECFLMIANAYQSIGKYNTAIKYYIAAIKETAEKTDLKTLQLKSECHFSYAHCALMILDLPTSRIQFQLSKECYELTDSSAKEIAECEFYIALHDLLGDPLSCRAQLANISPILQNGHRYEYCLAVAIYLIAEIDRTNGQLLTALNGYEDCLQCIDSFSVGSEAQRSAKELAVRCHIGSATVYHYLGLPECCYHYDEAIKIDKELEDIGKQITVLQYLELDILHVVGSMEQRRQRRKCCQDRMAHFLLCSGHVNNAKSHITPSSLWVIQPHEFSAQFSFYTDVLLRPVKEAVLVNICQIICEFKVLKQLQNIHTLFVEAESFMCSSERFRILGFHELATYGYQRAYDIFNILAETPVSEPIDHVLALISAASVHRRCECYYRAQSFYNAEAPHTSDLTRYKPSVSLNLRNVYQKFDGVVRNAYRHIRYLIALSKECSGEFEQFASSVLQTALRDTCHLMTWIDANMPFEKTTTKIGIVKAEAEILLATDRLDEAIHSYAHAYALYSDIDGFDDEMAYCQRAMSDIYSKLGRTALASECLDIARKHYRNAVSKSDQGGIARTYEYVVLRSGIISELAWEARQGFQYELSAQCYYDAIELLRSAEIAYIHGDPNVWLRLASLHEKRAEVRFEASFPDFEEDFSSAVVCLQIAIAHIILERIETNNDMISSPEQLSDARDQEIKECEIKIAGICYKRACYMKSFSHELPYETYFKEASLSYGRHEEWLSQASVERAWSQASVNEALMWVQTFKTTQVDVLPSVDSNEAVATAMSWFSDAFSHVETALNILAQWDPFGFEQQAHLLNLRSSICRKMATFQADIDATDRNQREQQIALYLQRHVEDHRRAIEWARIEIECALKNNDVSVQCQAYQTMIEVTSEFGAELSTAEYHERLLMTLSASDGHYVALAEAHENFAHYLRRLGRVSKACDEMRSAIEYFERALASKYSIARCYAALADLLRLERNEQCIVYYEKAIAICNGYKVKGFILAQCHYWLAETFLTIRQPVSASSHFNEALLYFNDQAYIQSVEISMSLACHYVLGDVDGIPCSVLKAKAVIEQHLDSNSIARVMFDILSRSSEDGYGNGTSQEHIREIFSIDDEFANQLLCDALRNATISEARELSCLIRFKTISASLGYSKYLAQWYATLLLADAASIKCPDDQQNFGFRRDALQISNADLGPVYNRVQANGVLIPGQVSRKYRGIRGLVAIHGVTWDSTVVHLFGERVADGNGLPMLFYNDIDVALALAFVDTDYKDYLDALSFSLEAVEDGSLPGERLYQEKIFRPTWLASTDFGRSLYYADYLMKLIAQHGNWLSLSDPTHFASMTPESEVPEIVTLLSECGGLWPTGIQRMEIKLRSLSVVETNDSDGRRTLTIASIDHGVEGASILQNSKGYEISRDLLHNNNDTYPGRFANLFSEHYTEIAQQFPVFERVRQLLALMRLVTEAKYRGLTISDRDRQRLGEMIDRKSNDSPKCLLVPSPFRWSSPTLTGGVSIGGSQVVPYAESNAVIAAHVDSMSSAVETFCKLDQSGVGPVNVEVPVNTASGNQITQTSFVPLGTTDDFEMHTSSSSKEANTITRGNSAKSAWDTIKVGMAAFYIATTPAAFEPLNAVYDNQIIVEKQPDSDFIKDCINDLRENIEDIEDEEEELEKEREKGI